jgi:hypothetical protein
LLSLKAVPCIIKIAHNFNSYHSKVWFNLFQCPKKLSNFSDTHAPLNRCKKAFCPHYFSQRPQRALLGALLPFYLTQRTQRTQRHGGHGVEYKGFLFVILSYNSGYSLLACPPLSPLPLCRRVLCASVRKKPSKVFVRKKWECPPHKAPSPIISHGDHQEFPTKPGHSRVVR